MLCCGECYCVCGSAAELVNAAECMPVESAAVIAVITVVQALAVHL